MRLFNLLFIPGIMTLVITSFCVTQDSLIGLEISGKASFYGPRFNGKTTANGEIFDQDALTCAHKSLPFGSILFVQNLENGKNVTVRINDRGPFIAGRILDLSAAAAKELDMLDKGVVSVSAKVIGENGIIQQNPFQLWVNFLNPSK